ncbi:hypothetical protein HPB51_025688 [Rhipicephalus microplus]|uniref:Uncharacterized protein n=1 Tax=Rhipicephalus microplus TaxID=6941 RepID=A0A9J6EPD1_RHIMP|nr:hypothetical protein HPB51_025688 [Rhipicephalus microplus]
MRIPVAIFINAAITRSALSSCHGRHRGSSSARGTRANLYGSPGGVITLQDLKSYTVKVEDALRRVLRENLTVMVPPPPAGGILTSFMLAVIDSYRNPEAPIENSLPDNAETFHRLIEITKFAIAGRMEMGDPDHIDISAPSDLTSGRGPLSLHEPCVVSMATPPRRISKNKSGHILNSDSRSMIFHCFTYWRNRKPERSVEGTSKFVADMQGVGETTMFRFSEDGFVHGCLDVFRSHKIGDYHEEVDGNRFEARREIADDAWKKDEIQEWLTSKNIAYNKRMIIRQLLELMASLKSRFLSYILDKKVLCEDETDESEDDCELSGMQSFDEVQRLRSIEKTAIIRANIILPAMAAKENPGPSNVTILLQPPPPAPPNIIRLHDLPVFSGLRGDNVEDWIKNHDLVSNLNRRDNPQKLRSVSFYLSEVVKTWF